MAAGWPFDGNGDNGGDPKLKDAGGRLRIPGKKAGTGGSRGTRGTQSGPTRGCVDCVV
jgi:hypothetical protein